MRKTHGAIKKPQKEPPAKDYEELKSLLKLDIGQELMDLENQDEKATVKKKKLSSKKRRYLKLLQSNPQREENPKDLAQRQIESAKKMMKEALSRGQRRRLKKKEKFVNKKLIEDKGRLLRDQKQPKEATKAGKSKTTAQSGRMLGDFGQMASILESIQQKTEKQ